MTLTNVVGTIFDHLRNGQKIVCTTFVRVIVTKPYGVFKTKSMLRVTNKLLIWFTYLN